MTDPKPATRPTPGPSRDEEARSIIQEYAADLRAIIATLRRRLS